MKQTRRSRAWWQQTVEKWRKSGATAAEFAAKVGVREGTLRWWSYELKAEARPPSVASAIVPVEIALPRADGQRASRPIELGTGRAVLRFEIGTDVAYIAALAQALG